ncbi:MAG TPA: hypothetical protein VNK52_01195 [Hyphomicrobiaceae bacterium]|nr:hypothetical protein [Hyphomicrobiaceae bacterium]
MLSDLYEVENWPKPLHLLRGVVLVEQGHTRGEAARAVGTTEPNLARVLAAKDRVKAILGEPAAPPTAQEVERRRTILGQLILGRAAELAFEDIYKTDVGTSEFSLDDYRRGRTDTDYRMLNGNGRPVWRINIKFIGSPFRKASEYVGLDPQDCFPLATYKIYAALQKQQAEHLAYLFLIVHVPGLTAPSVGDGFAKQEIEPLLDLLVSSIAGKRDLEDRFADLQVRRRHPVFVSAYERIRTAKWYVLSARRADALLRDKLFERVYAVRVPGFARLFGKAELDMHFSLKNDLHELHDFLRELREGGLQRASSMLERGDI